MVRSPIESASAILRPPVRRVFSLPILQRGDPLPAKPLISRVDAQFILRLEPVLSYTACCENSGKPLGFAAALAASRSAGSSPLTTVMIGAPAGGTDPEYASGTKRRGPRNPRHSAIPLIGKPNFFQARRNAAGSVHAFARVLSPCVGSVRTHREHLHYGRAGLRSGFRNARQSQYQGNGWTRVVALASRYSIAGNALQRYSSIPSRGKSWIGRHPPGLRRRMPRGSKSSLERRASIGPNDAPIFKSTHRAFRKWIPIFGMR